MTGWTPQAVLANIAVDTTIEAAFAAFAPPTDARVKAASATDPIYGDFLGRFTNPFGERIRPTILMVKSSELRNYGRGAAMASIRDILSICIVPRARAHRILNKVGSCVFYSKSFEFYPWMVSRDNKQLVAGTPGLIGGRDVAEFAGQTAPEVDTGNISPSDLDQPLFCALLKRWEETYGRQDPSWDDSKLMRALNMAFHASQPPADQGASVFDYGRILALWVSALEILVHTGNHADKAKVLEHLDQVDWIKQNTQQKASELCRALYDRRNDFLHGNPIDAEAAETSMAHNSLPGAAGCLFRMAAANFLGLKCKAARSLVEDADNPGKEIAAGMAYRDYQNDFEGAILRCDAAFPRDRRHGSQ